MTEKKKLTKEEAQSAKRDLEIQKEQDTVDRYKFLLGQSSLFSHFIKSKGYLTDAELKKLTENKTVEKKKGRHRKTEKEEDDELLQEELEEEITNGPLNTETIFNESPKYVTGGKLREYQVQGLNWLISLFEHGLSGILADEMGLGKTLQTISFLGYLKHYRDIKGPHMVLVPKSTLQNWVNEFSKWVPDFKVLLFHGNKEERQALASSELLTMNWEVCVTSYETCLLEKAHFRKIAWQYIVIDEAHRIKNENSLLSQIMRTFSCRNRLLLTGTPLQNNLKELWALLNFLLPDVFSAYEEFDDYLQNTGEDQDTVIKQLHAVLRPFLLRRLKADVEKSLLPKKRMNLYIGMSEMQKSWYQKILSKDIESVNGAVKDNREGKTRLLNIVMQLRKCCNHPYLFDGAEPGPPYTTDHHLVDNSGKMQLLDKLLDALKSKGSRVLLFSQMSRMLDILEDYCVWKGFEYCRIDGQTAHEDRIRDIDAFNKEGSSKFIFLLTTRAGGLGINLATADSVVMYDSDWNPQVDLQAEDRAHRIGQKKQVVVFRFVTENAIEEKVIERAASKLRLDQLVIQQGRVAQQNRALSKNDLVSMIRHGASSIFQGNASSVLDESIEEILKKGEERTKQLENKFSHLGLDDLQRFSIDSTSMYEFEGKDFSSKGLAASGDNEWIAPGKRDKKIDYSVDKYYKSQTQGTGKGAIDKQPKPPKFLNAHDFQFYPVTLYELQRKELLAFWKEVGYRHPRVTVTDEEEQKKKDEEVEAENQKINDAEPLTDDEIAKMDNLKGEGFGFWSKRDYQTFLKGKDISCLCIGCEKYGRDQIQDITTEIDGKTFEEVEAYSKVFWQNYKRLSDWESIIEKIEKGEDKIRKKFEVQDQLTQLVKQYKFPKEQLYIPYATSQKGKNYTEEEDRFMLVMLEKYGYNNENVYDLIRNEFRREPTFRFDWFIKSRTANEIARRCQTLINLLMKDLSEVDDPNSISGTSKRKGISIEKIAEDETKKKKVKA